MCVRNMSIYTAEYRLRSRILCDTIWNVIRQAREPLPAQPGSISWSPFDPFPADRLNIDNGFSFFRSDSSFLSAANNRLEVVAFLSLHNILTPISSELGPTTPITYDLIELRR